MNKDRLDKLIAHHSTLSRQEVKKLVRQKRVAVNDVTVTDAGILIDTANDNICIDGKPFEVHAQEIFLMLHKPLGYITSKHDPGGQPSVFDLLPDNLKKTLHAVGRLDVDSTGLLLFTSNGALTHLLTHPKHHVEKEYVVTVDGTFNNDIKTQLENGILLDNEITKPCKIINPQPVNSLTRLTCILTEGKNRQIRRMFAAFNCRVMDLQRIRLGNIVLGDLPEGSTRPLTKNEIDYLTSLQS